MGPVAEGGSASPTPPASTTSSRTQGSPRSAADVLAAAVKAYDVRGPVPDLLDAPLMRAIGSAFAQVVVRPEGAERIVLGHDMRLSSRELAAAFADGVLSQGVDVLMIGLCATDQVYFVSGSRDLPGAMITASHNPAHDNGVKLCRAGARPVGQDSGLAEIRDLAGWLIDRGALHDVEGRAQGQVELEDTLEAYADRICSLVQPGDGRPLTVVVDAGNGMGGLTAPAVLSRVPGVTMIPLYCDLDGRFPHHPANPVVPENLKDLRAAVLEHGADLGLAFDGDADRVVVVDETGRPVPPGVLATLVADRVLDVEEARGVAPRDARIVHGAVMSRSLPDLLRTRGSAAVRSRIGHSFIKAAMREHDAVFGAEHSAHYYFRDFWHADTGMVAALHVIAARASAPDDVGHLSDLLRRHEPYADSGELNVAVPTDERVSVLDRVRAWGERLGADADHLDGLTLDGVRPEAGDDAVDPPWWWVNVRGSNTEDLLRLNVEARDRPTLARVLAEVRPLLDPDAAPDPARQEARP